MSIQEKSNSAMGALCDYSSSSEDEKELIIANGKQGSEYNFQSSVKRFCGETHSTKALPAVPSSIRTMYAKTENRLNAPPASSLDANQHDQRSRSFPHARGNWPTSVFIKIPKDRELNDIQIWLLSKINKLWNFKAINTKTVAKNYGVGKLHLVEEPHISFTKVGVTLQYHWISSFTNSLKKSLEKIKSFYVSFGEIQLYFNEDKTRIFIALQTCGDQLPKCVDSVDNILKEFDQPEFYRTPKFHASILWCLPLSNESEENTNIQNSKHLDLETELQGFIKDINEEFRAAIKTGELDVDGFWVSDVLTRIGNKLFQFNLSTR